MKTVASGLALVLCCACSQAVLGQLQPTHPNLTYATLGPTPLRLDFYIPSGAAPQPFPVVVWIHGGGWAGGSKFPAGNAGILTQHGFAVASIDYRLTSQAGQFGTNPVIFPAQIHDCKGAIRWLRAHAKTYNLNADRFGAWGSSAGGHLAALVGTSGNTTAIEGNVGGNLAMSSEVQAVGDYFGPTDLLNMQLDVTNPPGSAFNHDDPGSPESHLIGFDQPGQGIGVLRANQFNPAPPFPALITLITQANPITWVDLADPPFHIAHGTVDNVVPQNQSTRLANALASEGVSHAYVPVVGGGHGTNFPPSITHATVAHFMHTLRHAPGDLNNDGFVSVDDLLAVINGWGPCVPAPNFCAAEATGDTQVNIDDVLIVINNWG
jgi:acetyl esterase/lipase